MFVVRWVTAVVSMGLRFRPNLVLDGPGPAFSEDLWREIVVNGNIVLASIVYFARVISTIVIYRTLHPTVCPNLGGWQ